jgi:hypothetical protein
MTTVSIFSSDGDHLLARISICWQRVTDRFSQKFDEEFQGKRKVNQIIVFILKILILQTI